MHLVLVGTSHHRAPVELREQLYVSAPENPELVRRLAATRARRARQRRGPFSDGVLGDQVAGAGE